MGLWDVGWSCGMGEGGEGGGKGGERERGVGERSGRIRGLGGVVSGVEWWESKSINFLRGKSTEVFIMR